MWIFIATYENMDLDSSIKSVKRKIDLMVITFLIPEMNVTVMR